MLDHILATAQAFEREHGMAPNVIYLNTTHFEMLQSLYPGLFDSVTAPDTAPGSGTPLGMHLVIVDDAMLVHPRAARMAGTTYTGAVQPAGRQDNYAIR